MKRLAVMRSTTRMAKQNARIVCWILAISGCLGLLAAIVAGQARNEDDSQTKYKFTLARIRYSLPNFGYWGRGGPPWSHDWPRGEQHFMKIIGEVTKIDVNPDGHIMSFETDEPFKYPIAYLCEVGFMNLSEKEARNMSEYLLRGGFLIVDDFRGERELQNFREQMKLVFPDRSLDEVPRTHPIWNCFYDISNLFIAPPYNRNLLPQYFGISDDKGRLMMIVNYNNDISEYWEWSDNPFAAIEETNEAYKYGVNYAVYALTH